MKKFSLYVIVASAVVQMLVSCGGKVNFNGDLDGMWQMLEWKDGTGAVKATKDSMIFYSFQLSMARLEKKAGAEFYMLSSVALEASDKGNTARLRLYSPVAYKGEGHDSIYPMEVLGGVGVPCDGMMEVVSLCSSSMVLCTAGGDTLKFRKY